MTSLRFVFYLLFCTIAGGAIAAGYVAFITLLGVFDKLGEKYKAHKYALIIENCIIIGVTLGNIIYLAKASIPIGRIGFCAFTLVGGIFTGCLAGALAETLNVFPIISRRCGIRKLLPYVLVAAALGKLAGGIIQQLYFP